MKHSKEITDELQSISPYLATIEKLNVFTVPEGYFSDLADKITTYTVLNVNEPLFNKRATLQAPENYFDTLSDQILAKIKSEESEKTEDELSSLMLSLRGKNVFTVPEGYFNELPAIISKKVSAKPAKVVSMSGFKKFWKYTAAAVITGAIAVSSLQIFNSSPDMNKNNSVVTESSGLPDYVKLSRQYATPNQVNQAISTLSDDAIVKYLEKHGSFMDDETLTNNVDTKELPSATDYLTDENTLHNYLQKVDASAFEKTGQ